MNILDTNLPKWPALTVKGANVTPDQAAEILIRTNAWTYGCNDHEWERLVYKAFGVKKGGKYRSYDLESMLHTCEQHHCLTLHYLCNQQIMSAWVGGPHGWCNWKGEIFANTYNIGKWPNVRAVLDEWQQIAEAFPYLDLRSQLWSGETGEDDTRPIVEFVVRNGTVEVIEPQGVLLPPGDLEIDYAAVIACSKERGCDLETVKRAIALTRQSANLPVGKAST